jgi:5-methylcytosine-specific restriction endonuclease McrA
MLGLLGKRQWTEEEVEQIWKKGIIDAKYDPNVFRKDIYGLWIKRSDYGKCDSDYGWEIDHVWPVSQGGSNRFDNLQPLHWKNNRSKGDGFMTSR